MIYSTYHHKDTYEDPKTSSVFETMLMLPDELFWSVLRTACFDNENLPLVAGQIEDYHFWPHWDASDTSNSILVEPDLFIRFQAFDLIIEAKFSDNSGQYSQQWKNEITAYSNEYGNEKPVYFIAVGGNAEKATEIIALSDGVAVNKCTWLSVLIQVSKMRDEYEAPPMIPNILSSVLRILNLTELAFNINGVYNIHWFDGIKTAKPLISPYSFTTFKSFFR